MTAAALAIGFVLLFFAGIEFASRFATRRRRKNSELNRRLNESIAHLEEALAQRHDMEKQLREGYKMAAMGTLSGGMAHELNNVLQPIVTLTGLSLEGHDLPAQHRDRMKEILAAAEQGAHIVQKTLAFAPGEVRETHEINLSDNLDSLVSVATDSLAPGIEIRTQVIVKNGCICVNRAEFSEVISQLLTNAAEAMNHNGRITAGLEALDLNTDAAYEQGLKAGPYLRVTIADQGPGIPRGVKNHIFEPFFSTKSVLRGDGCGLGLAVVYSLVRGWNGNISVDSAPGNGTEFSVLIPRMED